MTGTDTGVGKTTVSAGIAATLTARGSSVGVCKPVETGCVPGHNGERVPGDAALLKFFSRSAAELNLVCPYALRDPLAPLLAAEREGMRLDVELLVRCCGTIATAHDFTLVEGAGGLLVPITPQVTYADFALRLGMPVLLVVGSRLGAINHALLTVRYAESIGLRVLGYIVNFLVPEADEAARSNVEVLERLLGPALGVVPYLGVVEATEATRRRMVETISAQLRLERLLIPA